MNFSYGRLTLIAKGPSRPGSRMVHVRCECGQEKLVDRSALLSGRTKSCGCLRRECAATRSMTHGLTQTTEYRAWANMLQRCENANHPRWTDWGGRGIIVCAAWHSFEEFLKAVGPAPIGTSLDRVDNAGDYQPGNVRWATRRQQQQNTRQNTLLTVNGEALTIAEWSRRSGVPDPTIRRRVRDGWTPEEAITPVRRAS